MRNLIIINLAIIFLIVGCGQKSGVKIHNSTDQPINLIAVLVNHKNVQASVISISANTSQKYSPVGNIEKAWVKGGDVLTIEVEGRPEKIVATCVVPETESGVCGLNAHFQGTQVLICSHDCYDIDPSA